MSKTPASYSTFTFEQGKTNNVHFRSVIAKYTYYWFIFVLSILLMIALAYVYLEFAAPVYNIQARLLINQEKNPENQQESVLNKIDLPNTTEGPENQIAKLKSASLIRQVCNELQLGISYQIKKGIVYQDLYENKPFRVVLINRKSNPDTENSRKIIVRDYHSFSIVQANGKLLNVPFGKTIVSDFGTWKLEFSPTVRDFKGKELKITLLNPDNLVAYYQKKIDAALEDKLSSAIDLSLSDNSKQRGKDILNNLIAGFKNGDIRQKEIETQNTLDFIDQRLDSINRQLSSTERSIEKFKSANQLTDISANTQHNLEEKKTNDESLNDINVRLSIIDGLERFINSPQNKDEVPSVAGTEDKTLIDQTGNLHELLVTREKMLATMPATNPSIEPVNRQIETVKQGIRNEINNLRSSILTARQRLQTVNERVASSITSLPGQEREYTSQKRQQTSKETLYTYLLQKRSEVALNYATTVQNYRVLDTAEAGPIKWPNKPVVYAAAFLLGLLLPGFFIYLKDQVNDAVTDPDEIEEKTGLPIFSEFSFDKSRGPIVMNNRNTSLISEQFRTLRTKLHNLQDDDVKPRVVLITSSVSGEGKSFISSNLSAALAYAGRKTILLELDLRKSKISENFNLSSDYIGISDFLMHKASLNDVIQPSVLFAELDIIGRGTIVFNPSELLESGPVEELITELKKRYDNIIIDSPPVHLVTESMILSRYCDITLYIIRQGFTKRSELKFIKNLNDQNKLTAIQILFNGINNKKFGYGYDYDNVYYTSASTGRNG